MCAFRLEVRHDALGKYAVVSGQTLHEANMKARSRLAAWDEQYARQLDRESKKYAMETRKEAIESLKEDALQITRHAEDQIQELSRVLKKVIENFLPFDVDSLKQQIKFDVLEPIMLPHKSNPPEPNMEQFAIKKSFLDFFFKSRVLKKRENSLENFKFAYKYWEEQCDAIKKINDERSEKFRVEMIEWKQKKDAYENKINDVNREVDDFFSAYFEGNELAASKYFSLVLTMVAIVPNFKNKFSLIFLPEEAVLVVDFQLPALENMPNLKSVRFVPTKSELEKIYHKASYIGSVYDELVYQIALSVVFLIFSNDSAGIVKSVVFNCWTTYFNRATGTETTACIASLSVSDDEFVLINFSEVDAKMCFKSLKGIASPQVHSLTPIRPIINVNREDSRFVPSHDVIDKIDQGTNIAAIGWEEFEHLIREIFEKEFAKNGGEVKITQASRDGGVDAVAFDPDPIRGGKILIQAKRYSNTGDVSSVRDLFGTVMAEGATKGILVTTSGFGPDAHKFAKDKPITLIDGNNLLFLLGRHGYRARIDLSEAKKLGVGLSR